MKILFFIPFIVFTTLLLLNIRRKRGFDNISSLAIGLYATTGFCGGLLELFYPNRGFFLGLGYHFPPSLFALLYYALGTSVFLVPFYLFPETKIRAIRIENVYLMRLISRVLIVLSVYALIYNAPSALRALTGNLLLNRLDSVQGLIERGGVLNTIASSSSLLFPIVLLFFFWSIATRQSKALSALLFISSFSYVIHIAKSTGRAGFFLWPIIFFQTYLLFKRFLPHAVKRRIAMIGTIVSIIMIIPMGTITASRFSEPMVSVLLYAGQNVRNSNDRYQLNMKDAPLTWGRYTFPLVYEVKSIVLSEEYQSLDLEYEEKLLQYYGLKLYVFSGFLYSFFRDFGFVGALLFGILFSCFFLRCCRYRKHVINFGQVVLLVMFYQWPLQGLFYFMLGQRGGNLFMVNAFVIFVVLSLNRGNHKALLVEQENDSIMYALPNQNGQTKPNNSV